MSSESSSSDEEEDIVFKRSAAVPSINATPDDRRILMLLQAIKTTPNPIDLILSLNANIASLEDPVVYPILHQIVESIFPKIPASHRLLLNDQLTEISGRSSRITTTKKTQLNEYLSSLISAYNDDDSNTQNRTTILQSISQVHELWSVSSNSVLCTLIELLDNQRISSIFEYTQFVDCICGQAAINPGLASLINRKIGDQLEKNANCDRTWFMVLKMAQKSVVEPPLYNLILDKINDEVSVDRLITILSIIKHFCVGQKNPEKLDSSLAKFTDFALNSNRIDFRHAKHLIRLIQHCPKCLSDENIRNIGRLFAVGKSPNYRMSLLNCLRTIESRKSELSHNQNEALEDSISYAFNSVDWAKEPKLFFGLRCLIPDEEIDVPIKNVFKLIVTHTKDRSNLQGILKDAISLMDRPISKKSKSRIISLILEQINRPEMEALSVIALRKIAKRHPDKIAPFSDEIIKISNAINPMAIPIRLNLIFIASLSNPRVEKARSCEFRNLTAKIYSTFELYLVCRECMCNGLFDFACGALSSILEQMVTIANFESHHRSKMYFEALRQICIAESRINQNDLSCLLSALYIYRKALNMMVIARTCMIRLLPDCRITNKLGFEHKSRFELMIAFLRTRQSFLKLAHFIHSTLYQNRNIQTTNLQIANRLVTFGTVDQIIKTIGVYERFRDLMFGFDDLESCEGVCSAIDELNELKLIMQSFQRERRISKINYLADYFDLDKLNSTFAVKYSSTLKGVCSYFTKRVQFPRCFFQTNQQTELRAQINPLGKSVEEAVLVDPASDIIVSLHGYFIYRPLSPKNLRKVKSVILSTSVIPYDQNDLPIDTDLEMLENDLKFECHGKASAFNATILVDNGFVEYDDAVRTFRFDVSVDVVDSQDRRFRKFAVYKTFLKINR